MKKIREWFENIPEYDRMYIEEGVRCPGEMLEYVSEYLRSHSLA